MKLKNIYVKQFRCYREEIKVAFNDITTFIGKNDIGKSTIMEALEIFFNNETVKIGQGDLNNKAVDGNVTICCEFESLPDKLVLDADAETDLASEYLLTTEGTLLIKKIFDCSKKSPSSETYIVANHPCAEGYSDLLSLKQRELQAKVKTLDLEVNQNVNSEMRKAIWKHAGTDALSLGVTEICVSKAKEGAKDIWSKLENYIPAFALFQSDRNSTDGDNEVQSPMKRAVQMAIEEAEDEINRINEKIRQRAMEIASNTHAVLQTLDKGLAATIVPKFDAPAISKWTGLYAINMNTEDDIPLNKRGSGVRRMILLSFFKAEADRKAIHSTKKDVIYAIEEPETSMHPDYQRLMIKSFYELSESEHCQVVLTTHSPNLANELPTESLRFVTRDGEGVPVIKSGGDIIPEIVDTLGILPELSPRVEVVICVEGPTDVVAIKSFNRCLQEKYKDLVDVDKDERVAIIPLGGSILKYWVQNVYLQKLGCKEVHIYDNDVKTYQQSVDDVNARGNGSWATLTQKYEIENYLHPDAIKDGYNLDIDTTQKGVPALFGAAYAAKKGWAKLGDDNAKRKLSPIFEQKMNITRLEEVDQVGEIKGWFEKITQMLQEN